MLEVFVNSTYTEGTGCGRYKLLNEMSLIVIASHQLVITAPHFLNNRGGAASSQAEQPFQMQCLLPPVLLMLISTVTVADDSCRSECHEVVGRFTSDWNTQKLSVLGQNASVWRVAHEGDESRRCWDLRGFLSGCLDSVCISFSALMLYY